MSITSTSSSEIVVTGVDALIDLLKKTGQIDVTEAAKKLKYPVDTIQNWVDFLVEEKIIGIEYNLTTPSIYLITSQQNKNKKSDSGKEFDLGHDLDSGRDLYLGKELSNYKQDFQNNLQINKSKEGSNTDWKNHISAKLESMKLFFFREAEKRELKEPAKLWEEYKQKTIME
jgi:hypothetical protein